MPRYRHRYDGRTVDVEEGSVEHQRVARRTQIWAPLDKPPEPRTPPEPEPSGLDDGVHHAGGPWFDVVVGGVPVDKVQGRQAAEDRYAQRANAE